MNEWRSFEELYLSDIQPSLYRRYDLKYYPAAAVCSNGELHERVIFIDELSARKMIASYDWLLQFNRYWNEKVALDYHLIESVHPSGKRIPFEIVNQVINIMPGASFLFQTKDGKHINLGNKWNCQLGQIDFLELPEGSYPMDLTDLVKESVSRVFAASARPLPMGDIRICVFPSGIEINDIERLPVKDETKNSPSEAFEEYPVVVNRNTIEMVNQLMASSALIHQRYSDYCGDYGERTSFPRRGSSLPIPMPLGSRPVKELTNIDPGKERQYPCKVVLKDGTVLKNVVLIKKGIDAIQKLAGAFISSSSILPHFDYYVNADDISSVEESPNALPIFIRNDRTSETSMGSLEFTVEMRDGSTHACGYGGKNNFIDLPPPYRASEIKSFKVGRGYASQSFAYIAEPAYAICIYR
jgi:hypothetical protein